MTQKYQFEAKSINLRLMYGNLKVIVHDQPDIVLVAEGDEAICRDIRTHSMAGILKVVFPVALRNGGYATSGDVNRMNGHLCIDGIRVDEDRSVNVTIYVPHGTGIIVSHVIGNVTVADTKGSLEVNGAMGFELNAGSVSDCTLRTSSSFQSTVGHVSGTLDITTSSSAKTKVALANRDITLGISSNASVMIDSIASANVEINISNATVKISDGLCLHLTVNSSAGAIAELQCTADRATFNTSSGAKSSLKKCITSPTIYKSSGATVSVGH